MNRIKHWNLFSFSKSEFRGFLVLLIVILFLIFFRHRQFKNAGEFTIVVTENPSILNPKRMKKSAEPRHLSKENRASKERAEISRPLDPNRANYTQLLSAGMTPYAAKNLISYRGRGGKIRTIEELNKIYGIDSVQFLHIRQNFDIEEEDIMVVRDREKSESAVFPIEINSADSIYLKKLPGIGPVLSSRIIKFRDLLGGFYSVQQLSDVYGIDDSLLIKLEPYLQVDTNKLQKIDINKATGDQLQDHPYINGFQANAILSYRKLIGPFNSFNQLTDNHLINVENSKRLAPYIHIGNP